MTSDIISVLRQVSLKQRRLGDLLVISGLISTDDLQSALDQQQKTGHRLGRVLIDKKLISRTTLHKTLVFQSSVRFAITVAVVALSFVAVLKPGSASAEEFSSDVRQMISYNNDSMGQPARRVSLFGAGEVKSENNKPFTKWSDMFQRFETEFHSSGYKQTVDAWERELQPLKGLSIEQKADRVNAMMNDIAYAPDTRTWGKTDYWATPIEFMAKGSGDCEDYAIAKYVSLRALGIPEERMRIVILQDTAKNMPHAILAVYADSGVMILDNQAKTVKYDTQIPNYRPVYSINRSGWWLHKGQTPLMLASR